jgi:tRNA-Thr(GGU) m(6)t(6)A37 methyltransferase TsaA
MKAIGHVRSPFTDTGRIPKGPGAEHTAEGVLEIAPGLEAGLTDIEGFSHLYVIWVFDRAQGDAPLAVTPPSDDRPHGVFATRSPRRPNPIGLTVVELLGREGPRLRVRGVDMLDGTPILDLKPYLSNVPADSLRRGWLAEAEERRAASKTLRGRRRPSPGRRDSCAAGDGCDERPGRFGAALVLPSIRRRPERPPQPAFPPAPLSPAGVREWPRRAARVAALPTRGVPPRRVAAGVPGALRPEPRPAAGGGRAGAAGVAQVWPTRARLRAAMVRLLPPERPGCTLRSRPQLLPILRGEETAPLGRVAAHRSLGRGRPPPPPP